MYLFMFLILPVFFCFYAGNKKTSGVKVNWFLVGAGVFISVILCALDAFFGAGNLIAGPDYTDFFIEAFFAQVAIPFLFIVVIYIIAKDSLEVKVEYFLDFILPFYSVYLGVEIYSLPLPHTFFSLFVKPLLFLSMMLGLRFVLGEFCVSVRKKSFMWILFALLVPVEMVVPVLLETFWFYAVAPIVVNLFCVLYICSGAAGYVFTRKLV